MMYLHVVDYNISAIKFYTEKNGFEELRVEKDHYDIFDKQFDAIIFYRFLDREEILGENEMSTGI